METVTKIALVGTTTVGKTTLIEHYRKKFIDNPNVVIVEEAGRAFFERNKVKPEDRLSYAIQRRIQTLILENERRAHSTFPELILCDRSVLDAVVHCQAGGDFRGSNRLFDRVRNYVPSYSNIFLLDPTDISFQPDQIRQEDLQTRQHIHDTFKRFFQDTGIPYVLLGGSLEDKVSSIDHIVKRFF